MATRLAATPSLARDALLVGTAAATSRAVYLAVRDWHRLAAVLHRLAALEPRNGKHLQDLASVYARRGDVRGAYGYLRVYLNRLPDAADHDLVRGNLEQLEAAITAMN